MAISAQNLFDKYWDTAGTLELAGGSLTFYRAGTVTKKDIWTTADADVAQANPYTLDAAGRTVGDVWLDEDEYYDVLVKDSSGATIRTIQNVGTNVGTTPTTISESKNRILNPSMTVDNGTAAAVTATYTERATIGWLLKASNSSAGQAGGGKQTVCGESGYAAKVTGLTTSSGTVSCAQDIARRNIQDLIQVSADSTFACRVYHDAGVSLDYNIKIYTADAEDDFSAVTLRDTSATTSVSSTTDTQLTHTVDLSTLTNALNGVRFEIESACGAVTTKDFFWNEASLNKGSSAAAFTYPSFEVQQAAANWPVPTEGIEDGAATEDKIPNSALVYPLEGGDGTTISVDVDDTTIEVGGSPVGLRVKDGGIDTAALGDDSVTPTITSFLDAWGNPTSAYLGIIASGGGSFTEGPGGWSVANISTGVYEVTHNLGANTYATAAMGRSSGYSVAMTTKSTNTFRFTLTNAAGTAVDGPIEFILMEY